MMDYTETNAIAAADKDASFRFWRCVQIVTCWCSRVALEFITVIIVAHATIRMFL